MHTCKPGCTGVSYNRVPFREGTFCNYCKDILHYSEIAVYAHARRATPSGTARWYHVSCLSSIPPIQTTRATHCAIDEVSYQKGELMIPVMINNFERRLWIHPQALEAFEKIIPQLDMPKAMDDFIKKMESLSIEELAVEALSNHASTRKYATRLLKRGGKK